MRWRAAASISVLLPEQVTSALVPSDYVSTRVLGYSIIQGAWAAFYAAIANPTQWELLWYSGGSIDVWADPNHVAWAGSSGASGALINPTAARSGDPDRVILCVSGMSIVPVNTYPPGGYTNDVSVWIGLINTTIANIRTKYPKVRMILLQGPLGGPGWTRCTGYADAEAQPSGENRQTYHSLVVRSAITSVSKANVRQGAQLTVASCARFSDWAGHQDATGDTALGEAMAAYYASNL